MLCKNCNKCKGARVGYVSHRYWCSLTGDGWNGKAMGVYPWLDKPHPKCPLGLVDTLPKGKRKTNKEVRKMDTKQYYLNELERMFMNKQFQDMREFLGTGVCDTPCHKFKDDCRKSCSLFAALDRVEDKQNFKALNELNTELCLYLNAIEENNKEEK